MESGKYYPQIYEISSGINISADYRLDSDVPVTYWTPSEYPDLKAMPVPFAQKRTVRRGRWPLHLPTDQVPSNCWCMSQDGLIAVFISNCGPKNNRNEVLTQLIEVCVYPQTGLYFFGKFTNIGHLVPSDAAAAWAGAFIRWMSTQHGRK